MPVQKKQTQPLPLNPLRVYELGVDGSKLRSDKNLSASQRSMREVNEPACLLRKGANILPHNVPLGYLPAQHKVSS